MMHDTVHGTTAGFAEVPKLDTPINLGSVSLLLEATRILSSSLDLETTLASVARLSLPHLGSWCIVDLCEGHEIRRLAIIHPDPAQQWLADELLAGWPPTRNDALGIPFAVRSGRSEVICPVTDEILVKAAGSIANLELLRALKIGAVMTVPLLARGNVLGAITYVCPNQGDPFTELELVLAEDLAARCGMAIDNARLFKRALDSADEAPFVQVERRPPQPRSGTGLGLAISREPARRMGGRCNPAQRTSGRFLLHRLAAAGLAHLPPLPLRPFGNPGGASRRLSDQCILFYYNHLAPQLPVSRRHSGMDPGRDTGG